MRQVYQTIVKTTLKYLPMQPNHMESSLYYNATQPVVGTFNICLNPLKYRRGKTPLDLQEFYLGAAVAGGTELYRRIIHRKPVAAFEY